MKIVITYGTFDLFHQGHLNLLKRAKKLGDFLIVGVTSESYDMERGKLFVEQQLSDRIENVRKTNLADKIIVEEYEGQKISDIQKNNVDIFVIGSDWVGKFDFLKEYCEVIYLERTKNVSSTLIRTNHNILKIGIAGAGRIASRFFYESRYVSGCYVEGIYDKDINRAKHFSETFELDFYTHKYKDLLEKCDIIYIATPHHVHYEMTKVALNKKKNVICEKPITLKSKHLLDLYRIADEKGVVLMEAIKTAYAPAFYRLLDVARSSVIGDIKNIEATFTKLAPTNSREFDVTQAGGAINELASYPLLVIVKILGRPQNTYYYPFIRKDIDIATKVILQYKDSTASVYVAIGAKSEGDLRISGTKGYIYVPAPWWKTQEFELKFEDHNKNKKYFYKFEGDGLRYEIAEMMRIIRNDLYESWKLSRNDSLLISEIIENFHNR